MKVPPKRKGNGIFVRVSFHVINSLNESPSEKEGKLRVLYTVDLTQVLPSMKVPPKRKGNTAYTAADGTPVEPPSMKVPPKRKGNTGIFLREWAEFLALNESPSEKEGKLEPPAATGFAHATPSMKVPPKRKGN